MSCETITLASSQALGRERCLQRGSQPVPGRHWGATISTDGHRNSDNINPFQHISCNKEGWACGVPVSYILSQAAGAALGNRAWPHRATCTTSLSKTGDHWYQRNPSESEFALNITQNNIAELQWLRDRFFKGVRTPKNQKRALSGIFQNCLKLLSFHLQDFISFWKILLGACLHL